MEKLLSIILSIILIAFLFLAQSVEAISLGTVVKKDKSSLCLGESAKFTILFWNTENNPYKVELEVKEAPKDWLIIMEPKEFLLDSSTGKENIALLSGKIVKAFPVNVFVKPTPAEPGLYSIHIIARAGYPEEGISFFQERDFKLNIEILGEKSQQETIEETATSPNLLTGKLIAQEIFPQLSYIIIFCILVISLLIYKYA